MLQLDKDALSENKNVVNVVPKTARTLSIWQVIRLFNAGWTCTAIGKQYGVTRQTVSERVRKARKMKTGIRIRRPRTGPQ
jgi:DNA-binding transcriptional regulator LsrR (DeoR family)